MKLMWSLVAAAMLTATSAFASVVGSTSGPDDSFFPIDMFFQNNNAASITQLSIDGSTADAGVIVWDFVGTPGGTATLSGSSGEDTSVMSFMFSSFSTGQTFSLSTIDPDFLGAPSSGITIGDLEGTMVTAWFDDQTSFMGVFVDDPRRGKGLILTPVPLPAGLPLLLAGLGALGIARRVRK